MAEPLALFALDLQQPSALVAATSGYFTQEEPTGTRDLVLVRQSGSYGATIECWAYNAELGKLQRVQATSAAFAEASNGVTFAHIWHVAPVRSWSGPDHLLVVSDSGTLSLLRWCGSEAVSAGSIRASLRPWCVEQAAAADADVTYDIGWKCVSSAVFSKPGARASRPGAFLAIDEQSQACALASLDGSICAFALPQHTSEASTASKAGHRLSGKKRNPAGTVLSRSATSVQTSRENAVRRSSRRRKRPLGADAASSVSSVEAGAMHPGSQRAASDRRASRRDKLTEGTSTHFTDDNDDDDDDDDDDSDDDDDDDHDDDTNARLGDGAPSGDADEDGHEDPGRTTRGFSAPIEWSTEDRMALGVGTCFGLVALPWSSAENESLFVMLMDRSLSTATVAPGPDRRLLLLLVDRNAQTVHAKAMSSPLDPSAYGIYALSDGMLLIVSRSTVEVWCFRGTPEANANEEPSSGFSANAGTFSCLAKLPHRALLTRRSSTRDGAHDITVRNALFDSAHLQANGEPSGSVLITAAALWEAACSREQLCVLLGDEDGYLFRLTIVLRPVEDGIQSEALSVRMLGRFHAPVSALCFLGGDDIAAAAVFVTLEQGDHAVVLLDRPQLQAGKRDSLPVASALPDTSSDGTSASRTEHLAGLDDAMSNSNNTLSIVDTIPGHHPVITSLLLRTDRCCQAEAAQTGCLPTWQLLGASATADPNETPLRIFVPMRDTVALAQSPVDGRAQRVFALPPLLQRSTTEPAATLPPESVSDTVTVALLVLSFTQQTRVFRFQSLALHEEHTLGFEHNTSTIHAALLCSDWSRSACCWVQVHSHGVRLIGAASSDSRSASVVDVYTASTQQPIVAADSTLSQVLLLLADGQLVYLVASDTDSDSDKQSKVRGNASPPAMELGFGPRSALQSAAAANAPTEAPPRIPPSPTSRAVACCLVPLDNPSWSSYLVYVEAGASPVLRICQVPERATHAPVQCLYSVLLPQLPTGIAAVHTAGTASLVDLWAGLEDGTLLRVEAVDVAELQMPTERGTPRLHRYHLGAAAGLRLRRVLVPPALGTEALLVLGSSSWLIPLSSSSSSSSSLWTHPYPIHAGQLLDAASFPLPQMCSTVDPETHSEAVAVFPAATAIAALSEQGRTLQFLSFAADDSGSNLLTIRPVSKPQPADAAASGTTVSRKVVRKLCWIFPNELAAIAISTEGERGPQVQLQLVQVPGSERVASQHLSSSDMESHAFWQHLRLDGGVRIAGAPAWGGIRVTSMISVDLPSLSLPSSDTKNEQQLHAAGRMPVALLVAVAPPAAEAETAPESGDVARAFLLTYLVERQAASDAPWKLVLTERLSFPESIGDLCRVGRHLVVAHGNRLALYTHTRCGWRPLTVSKRALASPIVALTAHEALCRIFVASLHHGISLFKYYVQENRLVLVAEDMQRRWIHRLQLLDADTVVAADKFGSIAVLRLPVESSAAIEDDPSYGRLAERYGASPESARPFVARLMPECSVHVGSVVTSLHVFGYGAATDPDATPASAPRSWTEAEAILYGTVSGGFGMLIPFRTRAEWDIVQRLERELHLFWAKCCAPGHTMDATHTRNLLHASVLRFQGRIEPTRHVVNGHLCGLFALLDPETQRSIAARVLGLQEPSTPSEEQRALTLLLSTLHRLYARVLWPLGHEVQAAPLHAT